MKYFGLIKEAWKDYDNSRKILSITDISIKVSTNHVYRIILKDGSKVIAKISDYGYVSNFSEDHSIINALSINLTYPFENFLAKSLTKNGRLYIYEKKINKSPIWVVFYNPIRTDKKPTKKQSIQRIKILGKELGSFHLSCKNIRKILPHKSKTFNEDIKFIKQNIFSKTYLHFDKNEKKEIIKHCDIFIKNTRKIINKNDLLPVFIDWNIGNFSVDNKYNFFSRWDYDWFRIGHRTLDFYFLSRVCSEQGDSTLFTYSPLPLMEKRFMIFLKSYHKIYPLKNYDFLLIPEMYRFFILNYVIKDGFRFFNKHIAKKLIKDSVNQYLPNIDKLVSSNEIKDYVLS